MKLEQAIKSKFKTAQQKALLNVVFSSNWISERFESKVRNQDITMQQYNVMRILRGSLPNPLSVKDIRSRMLDRMSDVSRIVEKLKNKGYLQRTECAKDRRNVDVSITELGLKRLAELDELINPVERIFDVFSEEELQILNDLLDNLRIRNQNWCQENSRENIETCEDEQASAEKF